MLPPYINQILEKEVIKWIQRGDDFILEQDGASGHGDGPKARQNNPVAVWFSEKGVEMFFNCHDFENSWQGPRQYAQNRPYWDQQTLREILCEGWAEISQDHINWLVETMPQWLHDCMKLFGGLRRGGNRL